MKRIAAIWLGAATMLAGGRASADGRQLTISQAVRLAVATDRSILHEDPPTSTKWREQIDDR